MQAYEPYIALNRFGLGARPGDAKHIANDPRGWLKQQIDRPAPVQRIADRNRAVQDPRKRFVVDVGQRLQLTIGSEQPFHERWIMFWTNHFTVSTANEDVRPLAVDYEENAIRPNVYGSFFDLLLAVVRHPAMLNYLDNVRSIGPHSVAGLSSLYGLNENLAREILELHTLGVSGGYQQEDVVQLAKVLTGWTVDAEGMFKFVIERHEPRDKVILGRTFPWGRDDEGIDALRFIAAHPSTAQFLAKKLARHFIADDPPESAVERLSKTFTASGGDLRAMAHAVVETSEAWDPTQTKIRRADEFVIAALRATGIDYEPEEVFDWLTSLGQRPFSAPAPKGWSDEAGDWIAPGQINERIKLCFLVASRIERRFDPNQLAKSVLGPYLPPRSADAIAKAASSEQAVALMLASPEFQRR